MADPNPTTVLVRASQDVLTALSGFPTPILGDCMQRLTGTYRLRPVHGLQSLHGIARTVKVAPGDNLFIHKALNDAHPGEVIVVDGAGDTQRALVGELMMLFAQAQGVAGFVIDGAVRDAEAFRRAGFPCFAMGQTLRGPYKNGPGAVQIPVTVDGMIVKPGDYIIADEDGVLAISPDEAEALLAAATATAAREEETKRRIADGTNDRSWVERALAAGRS